MKSALAGFVLGFLSMAGLDLAAPGALADTAHSDPNRQPGKPAAAADLPDVPLKWATQADGKGVWLPQDVESADKLDGVSNPDFDEQFTSFGNCVREHGQPLQEQAPDFIAHGYLKFETVPNGVHVQETPLRIGDDSLFDKAYVHSACKAAAFQ